MGRTFRFTVLKLRKALEQLSQSIKNRPGEASGETIEAAKAIKIERHVILPFEKPGQTPADGHIEKPGMAPDI